MIKRSSILDSLSVPFKQHPERVGLALRVRARRERREARLALDVKVLVGTSGLLLRRLVRLSVQVEVRSAHGDPALRAVNHPNGCLGGSISSKKRLVVVRVVDDGLVVHVDDRVDAARNLEDARVLRHHQIQMVCGRFCLQLVS